MQEILFRLSSHRFNPSFYLVPLSNIAYIFAQGNRNQSVTVKLLSGDVLEVKETLNDIEDQIISQRRVK